MASNTFVKVLETFASERLAPIIDAGQTSLADGHKGESRQLLQLALANEICVS